MLEPSPAAVTEPPWLAVGSTPSAPPWRARAFAGAELGYAELLAAEDQRALALDFLQPCLDDLQSA